MGRSFVTTVEGQPEPLRDEFEGFEVKEMSTYASADAVPRSVRLLIAQAALLRGLTNDRLAALYGMPITWIDRFVVEATPADLACETEAHGVKLGQQKH
jgi:hypothetical protein